MFIQKITKDSETLEKILGIFFADMPSIQILLCGLFVYHPPVFLLNTAALLMRHKAMQSPSHGIKNIHHVESNKSAVSMCNSKPLSSSPPESIRQNVSIPDKEVTCRRVHGTRFSLLRLSLLPVFCSLS